jgi:flagellar FliJ protein
MPFTFRLEPLISIRDNVLKQKQAELAKAYEARRIIEETKSKIEKNIEDNLQSAREMQQSRQIDVKFLFATRQHEIFLFAQLEEIRRHIRMIEEEIEVRRNAVIEANKELKIIEKLKKKKHEKYLAEENRKETIQMDEIASRRKNVR